jgi:hypothetical protein
MYLGLPEIPKNLAIVQADSNLKLSDKLAIEKLKILVKSVSPSIIIFDTYVRLVDNDESKSLDTDKNCEELLEILQASEQPCAGILVHHSGKDPSKKMRGSSALLAAVTTSWKVFKVKGRTRLSIDDANAFDAPEPIFFTIESVVTQQMGGDRMQAEVGVAVPVKAPLRPEERSQRIIGVMRNGTKEFWSLEEVRGALSALEESISAPTMARALSKMVDNGLLISQKRSKCLVYAPANA